MNALAISACRQSVDSLHTVPISALSEVIKADISTTNSDLLAKRRLYIINEHPLSEAGIDRAADSFHFDF